MIKLKQKPETALRDSPSPADHRAEARGTCAGAGLGEGTAPPTKEACATSLRHVRDALYVLGGKWSLPVVLTLMGGPMRFNELLAELEGISPKVLTKELKDLEVNEFVRRNVYPGSPDRIVYEATEHSLTLREVLGALSKWGREHREMIRRSMRND